MLPKLVKTLVIVFRFVKCWNRGENSCSRCDLEYMPVPNSRHACRRENKSVKASESNAKLAAGLCKPCDDRQMDIKKEEKVKIVYTYNFKIDH